MSNIKVIGFDLDQTLYPKSPEIDEAIQVYLFKKISDHLNIPLPEARKMFTELYKDGAGLSGSKTLAYLGVPNADNSIQEALELADITKFLHPNPEVISLIKDLKAKYQYVDIITGSNLKITLNKLECLGIDSELFNVIITNDDASKSNSDAYKLWLAKYPTYSAKNFVYIGDRLKTDHYIPEALGIQTIMVNQRTINPEITCPQLPTLLDIRSILL